MVLRNRKSCMPETTTTVGRDNYKCMMHWQVQTCRLSAADQQEAEQSRCAGNATLPGTEDHTPLVENSADCDQLLRCTASLNRQTILAHESKYKNVIWH